MSSSKITGIGMMIRRHNLLYASRPALFASGQMGGRLFSDSDTRSESQGNELRERTEKTMGTVIDAAKTGGENFKDRVMGNGGNTAGNHPSKDPEQNHGVEKTDSSCEDVRGRPGGYS